MRMVGKFSKTGVAGGHSYTSTDGTTPEADTVGPSSIEISSPMSQGFAFMRQKRAFLPERLGDLHGVSSGLADEPTLQPKRGLYIATGAAGTRPGCYQSTCAIAESRRCNTATTSPHASAASSSASPADTRPVNLPRISTWVLHQRPDQCWGALAGLCARAERRRRARVLRSVAIASVEKLRVPHLVCLPPRTCFVQSACLRFLCARMCLGVPHC